MKKSVQSRLLTTAAFFLVFFLTVAGFVFDKAYQKGAYQALDEQLQIHLYNVLASSEVSQGGQIQILNNLSDPRFSRPDSGLNAQIFNIDGMTVWRSRSSIGLDILPLKTTETGQAIYQTKGTYRQLHYSAIFETSTKQQKRFEFVISGSNTGVLNQINEFRDVLWLWLGGTGVVLIVVQFLLIRQNLNPLRQIVMDMENIHQGSSEKLAGEYSVELQDIANTINQLIVNERTHLSRYRNTLADLAHSLKTPLTVLSGLYQQEHLTEDDKKTIKQQTAHMRQLIDYQLQKAAAKGHKTMMQAERLETIVQQLTNSLEKVYADKKISLHLQIEKDLSYRAEKGDLYELFGNLLDNAYKWAKTAVWVSISSHQDSLRIVIEDDGMGIEAEVLQHVLQRGTRADENTAGHGIGLAVVNELVGFYNGKLTSKTGREGGQRWEIELPL